MVKILKFLLYTLIFGSLLMIIFPYLLITLNDSLGLFSFSFLLDKILGVVLIIAGASNYLYCSFLFWQFGKGTPLFTQSPTKFVSKSFYKYSRNPIYLGHLLMFFGEFLFFGKILLLLYLFLMFIVFNLIVIYYEEPSLSKKFGTEYTNYLKRVPRWL